MVNDPKLPPDQLIAEVRINPPGVEQINPIPKFTALLIDLLQIHLRTMQLARVIPPGEYPVRSQYNVAGEEKKKKHRYGRPQGRKKQHAKLSDMRHGSVESQ